MSRSADLYSLSVKMDLQTAAFQKGVAQANKSLDRMDRKFKKSGTVIKKFAAGLASAFTIKALVQFTKSAIAAGDAIDKASKTVGLTAEQFQRLGHAASLSGVSMSLFESSMTAFVKRIGEAQNGMGPLVSGLKNVDKELLDSLTSAKDQNEAFKILSDAYEKLETDAERAALMNAAFGRSGIKMGVMMRKGADGVDHLAGQIDVLTNVNVNAAADFTDRWYVAFSNFQTMGYNAILNVMRNIDRMTTEVKAMNLDQLKDEKAVLANSYLREKKGSESWDPFGRSAAAVAELKTQIDAVDTRIIALSKRDLSNLDALIKPEALAKGVGGGGSPVKAIEKVTKALRNQNRELTDFEEGVKSATERFASGFSDTLVDGIMDSKFAFEDFAKSFLANIAKMIIQAQILAAVKSIPVIGALFGGSAGTNMLIPAAAGIGQMSGIGTFAAPTVGSFGTGGVTPLQSIPAPAEGQAGSNVSINQTFDFRGAQDVQLLRAESERIKSETLVAVEASIRRGGSLARLVGRKV